MDIVEAVLRSIEPLNDAWSSISRCFNYRKILDNNCTNIKEKMERLKGLEQDVYAELQNAQNQRKKEKKEVENWLKEVQNRKDEVERMEGEASKRRCFSRLRLLKESEENIKKVDDLLERGRFPKGILIDVVRDEGKALLVTQLTGETTAKSNMEKIWKCLKEGGTQSIGVRGMGGIGKTFIVTHIHNLLLKENDTFGSVYWVTVSKDSSIRKLQDAIARKINLDLSEEEDEKIRSASLFEALQKEKKFVVIFDDVWEVYPTREVGIPIGVVDGGGGLIITTRSREVCLKMGCKEIIKVEPLHEVEAWELFNTTFDRYEPLSQEEEKIAKDIVKECAGLPLAVVTTARSMSVVYDIAEWRNAWNELRGLVKGHTIDLENDVFKVLEFSYNRLNNENLQECLLYCALFPADFEIKRMDLIRYWTAEGLVEEVGSRQAERDRRHAILNKLENLCLLERCKNGECVKMHDVVRDMAINITGRNSRFIVKTGRNIDMEDLSSDQKIEWSCVERVSLIESRLSTSMSVPNCPKLSTLLLQKVVYDRPDFGREVSNEGLPTSFLMHMVELRVLDLSRTNIEFLPDSIYDMVNLRALILFDCRKLKHVGSLGKLKELRRLDLGWNDLEKFPDGIEKLVHLKESNWTRFGGRQPFDALVAPQVFKTLGSISSQIPNPVSDILPNLAHLQCLILHDTGVEDVGLEELSGLRKLEILSVIFSNRHNFNNYVRKQYYRRLTHYYVQLSGTECYNPALGYLSKKVALRDCRLIGAGTEKEKDDEYEQLLVLPANIRVLEVIGCELPTGLMDVSPSLKTAMDLKACEIKECRGIEYVWLADDDDDCINIASSLNTLHLEDLTNLRVLFMLRPTGINVSLFSNLKHLFVGGCDNLKHLFTAELVKCHLRILQTIVVYNCSGMEYIIVAEAEAEAEAEEEEEVEDKEEEDNIYKYRFFILRFPNLQRLELVDLPKLKGIWKHDLACYSLQRLVIWNCPNLKRLPFSVKMYRTTDGGGRDSDSDGRSGGGGGGGGGGGTNFIGSGDDYSGTYVTYSGDDYGYSDADGTYTIACPQNRDTASSLPFKEIIVKRKWWDEVEWDTHPEVKSLVLPLLRHPIRLSWLEFQRRRLTNLQEITQV